MTTSNTQEQLKEYLYGSIPYRLQSLRFCYRVCNLQKDPHPDYGDELWIGEIFFIGEERPIWFGSVIESGLIYCRVLLEFLGITRDPESDHLKITDTQTKKRKQWDDDICIATFGLEKITVEQAIAGFSYASQDEVSRALLHVIEIANKTVAHLTVGPKVPGTFTSLRLACRVVIELVWRHLYVPLTGTPLLEDPIFERPPVTLIDEND